MRWVVQTLQACGGWENVWFEDDLPMTFENPDEANAELEEHAMTYEAQGMGVFPWDEHRIVEVKS